VLHVVLTALPAFVDMRLADTLVVPLITLESKRCVALQHEDTESICTTRSMCRLRLIRRLIIPVLQVTPMALLSA